ncbi:hypothetical protein [Streptomyces sp. NPDC058280]|uniref:hypothetical protein n=1 Tax=Streptomyces sp. NPDC058280 TaxID=3346419 RepID=UPI0036EA9D5C
MARVRRTRAGRNGAGHHRFGARRRFRRLYGESPLQLLLLLASFALCAYAGIRLLKGDWLFILLWFVGAAVLHDLVLVPLYALGDRAVRSVLRPRGAVPRTAVHHVRVPAAVSLLLLLVYWPLVLRTSRRTYEADTRLTIDVFLGRWLLITAALFALSAVWLVIRLWRPPPSDAGSGAGPGELVSDSQT